MCNFELRLHSGMSEIEGRLPCSRLVVLCRNEAVLKWMSSCDHLMYQALVEILIPDVLRPIPSEWLSHTRTLSLVLSWTSEFKCWSLNRLLCFLSVPLGALTQAIRNFAKSLEGWLNNAMNTIPQRMIQTKVKTPLLAHLLTHILTNQLKWPIFVLFALILTFLFYLLVLV